MICVRSVRSSLCLSCNGLLMLVALLFLRWVSKSRTSILGRCPNFGAGRGLEAKPDQGPMNARGMAPRMQVGASPKTGIVELKQAERLFLIVRCAAVPMVLVLGWLHDLLPFGIAVVLAVVLVVVSAGGWYANRRIASAGVQHFLGASMLALDTVLTVAAISVFLPDRSTAAYAAFALVVIEAAVRYGFRGSVAMAALFAVATAEAMQARLVLFDVRPSMSGYAFWTLFMAMLALAVGALELGKALPIDGPSEHHAEGQRVAEPKEGEHRSSSPALSPPGKAQGCHQQREGHHQGRRSPSTAARKYTIQGTGWS